MLSLVVAMALAQAPLFEPRFSRLNSRTAQGRSDRGLLDDDLAFFEAFPASGRGTSGVCSTTMPTGAKGEALAFARGSNGTCTKTTAGGFATTGIANGDLVVLSSDVARVEYDSDGVLKFLREVSKINYLLRSEEPSNAAWTKESSGTATTVTADQATAPDNASTADRIVAIATSGAGFADIYQSYTTAATGDPTTCSVYIKGNGTSDTTDLCRYDGAGWACSACSYVSDSWTRCVTTDTAGAGSTSRSCKLGNNSNQNGGVSRNALDAFIWGFQGEASTYATSYIPTTSATVTRSADGSLDHSGLGSGLSATGCVAATFTPPFAAGGGTTNFGIVGANHASSDWLYGRGVGNTFVSYDGTNSPTAASSWVANTPKRGRATWDTISGLDVYNVTDTTTGGSAFDGTMPGTAVQIGGSAQAGVVAGDGLIGLVQLDPDPSRCR